MAGRVTGQVTRVVYRTYGRTVELPVGNGIYVGRIVFDEQATVRANAAFDGAGRLVGSAVWPDTSCALTPDGTRIGSRATTIRKCRPAVPWR